MAKVSYASLKLKTDESVKSVQITDSQAIDILQYLPIEDKYDLIEAVLQNSEEEGYFNSLKLDVYFQLYLVYMYSNLSFTEKQRENELKIYDNLQSNGILGKILQAIPEQEYNDLIDFLEEEKDSRTNYNTSFKSTLQTIVQDLPANAQAAMDIVNSFDPDKYQAVKDFAQAANGGREI